MTTQRSSSRRTSSSDPITLSNANGQPFPLGNEIGRGGEGSVHELASDPSLVVKIYHKFPLPDEQVAKLRAMTSVWSPELERISAWPREILFDPVHRKPCGLLMSKMSGALPLHELYGTTNRRRHFPDVGWHHLVLAARNTAAAFQMFHSAGIVVGDVNQGNLLVDQKMCVRMIDCDSFQITRNGATYKCPVGSPHFTPPELQGLRLREVLRSENHDRFGLASLVFHLLFVGRHPFAGRYRGPGDMSIERAIAENRFAFSRDTAVTKIEAPPASLLLDDLPRPIGEMFEAAFRSTGKNGRERPTPKQWIEQLELLIQRRRTCQTDPMHIYSADNAHCPWCRIEDIGGPSFFVPANAPSTITSNRLARLDDKVMKLREVRFPMLVADRLALPTIPRLKEMKPPSTWNLLDVSAAVVVVSWLACLVGAVYSLPALFAGAALSVVGIGVLLGTKRSRASRQHVHAILQSLQNRSATLEKRARRIERDQRIRLAEFQDSVKDLAHEQKNYRAEGDELAKVIVENRHTQLDDFLNEYSIRDNFQKIQGLTQSHVTILESYGVESAYHLERIKLYGIPSIHSALMIELLHWRSELERQFVFKPEHGVTLDNLKSLAGAAVQRFKMTQARKILMGDERLRAFAEAGKEALVRDVTAFDIEVLQWKTTANELCEHQKTRTLLERTINRSPATLILPGLIVLIAAGLLFFIRHGM
jgi:DNA-binding helix-hairpin-helix protein with protein kinase domain